MDNNFRASGWRAALGLALAFGVGGYAVARAKDGVSTTHVRASLKLADPSEGPSKTGFAPVVKEVLPNVVNISSSKVVKTARNQMQMPEGMEKIRSSSNFLDSNLADGAAVVTAAATTSSRRSSASRALVRASL